MLKCFDMNPSVPVSPMFPALWGDGERCSLLLIITAYSHETEDDAFAVWINLPASTAALTARRCSSL